MKRLYKEMLKKSLKGKVSFNESLKEHTTFKIGGIPKVYFEPESIDDLQLGMTLFLKKGLKPFIIGSGSNLLISDGEIDRAFIKLSAPAFKAFSFKKDTVICGSGLNLQKLIRRCIDRGLSGPERLAGIPATVGGAIMMNAGPGKEGCIGDMVEWVKAIKPGRKNILVLHKDKLKFVRRDSGLSGYVILEAALRLKRSRPDILKKRYKRIVRCKMSKQEYRFPNAGCIFKNPQEQELTSGEMIDQLGLKGLSVGGAEVSSRHANFIINKNSARFADVFSLMKLQQEKVKKHYGVWLKPEIRIVR
ncbi:MAG: UDP-N-acetylmuramate dehydrogenase [Candidatus Omnitrophica bacterium]|nr:UDP-N-acetylmuramate dehydrogenase [Candidatus Omnitrophota bacterium]